MKRRKIWFGLGAAVMVTSGVAAGETAPPVDQMAASAPLRLAQAGQAQGGHAPAGAAASQGGEGEGGGEGGAAYDAGLAPALRFYRDIELMRGHLLIGGELVQQGRWAEALPHFLHPSEELYGKVRADLKTYEVAPFTVALKALAQTVKAKNEGAYRSALAALEERLAQADRGVRAKQSDWPPFVIDTVLEMLRVATNEYEEAIDKGRIAKAVEYQDARGFVWEAERLLNTVAADLERKDAEAFKGVQALFAELRKAWPQAVAPKAPVKDVGQVLSDVSRIELQLGRFK